MTVKIKYFNGDYEEITCDKIECDGSVFILKTKDQDDVVISYDAIENIDY